MLKLFFCLVITLTLNASWKDVLNPCPNKGENHSIEEIDFIYVVNLAVRQERWLRSARQLEPYGIYPYRFNAVNGWDMNPAEFKHLGCPNLSPGMTGGKIGCSLSFLSVISDAYYSGYETIWFMEDDIDVVEDPRQIPGLIRELDELVEDWDILYTDVENKHDDGDRVPALAIAHRKNIFPLPLDFYLRRIPINETFVEIGMRYGCYSMIIRRSGLKKIMRYFTKNQMYLPIDLELQFIPGLKQIVLTRDIVSTIADKSDSTTHYNEK